MEALAALWQGLAVAVMPEHLAWAFAGCILGTAMGVLPGFAPSAAIAVLLPMSFHGDITATFIFFIAIACGGMYGGSTTSILLNSSGESASLVTAMEGKRMALNGRAGTALATAAIGSFIAGSLASGFVVWAGPWVADIANSVGPAELFMLMVMALGAVSAALGKSTLRGVTALFVGIALACVGLDAASGVERLTAGQTWLQDGMDVGLIAVGLFVLTPVLYGVMYEGPVRATLHPVGAVRMERLDWKRSWRPWLRGTLIGTPLGCVPVGGIDMPTYISYASERYMVREQYRSEFGREGAIEGVAGPEAANNATVTAALVPLLAMGIPTSNTTAVMLGAFQNYGAHPGHQWFSVGHGLVWALIASLLIANLMLLVLNLPLVRVWTVLLRLPRPQLHAAMLVLATAGVYGLRQSVEDLLLLYAVGLAGVGMRRFDFPVTPLVIGLVLGPLAEMQLHQAVAVGHGSLTIFVQRPLALMLLILVVMLVVMPHLLQGWARRRMAQTRS